MAGGSDQIDTVMKEKRLFAPPAEFASRARIKSLAEYQSLWDEAAADPEKFWADLARGAALVQTVRTSADLERAGCAVVCRREDKRLI